MLTGGQGRQHSPVVPPGSHVVLDVVLVDVVVVVAVVVVVVVVVLV